MRARFVPAALVLCVSPLACQGEKEARHRARPTGARVVISEILYHPVLPAGPVEEHEFVELHNHGAAAASLAGWTLAGAGVSFTFPATARIEPGAHLVVAKTPAKLAAVASYQLGAVHILGGYAGALDNGGGTLTLRDARGAVVDEVPYSDRAPWPAAADAFGAGAGWLPADLLPLAKHQARGISLERVSAAAASIDPANWVASPIDGATPGRPNTVTGAPLPIARAVTAAPDGRPEGPVRATDAARIRVAFTADGVMAPRVEYFVDDLAREDEPRHEAPLVPAAGGAHEALLPAQAANAIVRYRIVGDRGRGAEPISPRPGEPFAHHAYFVTPELDTRARVYHLQLSNESWGRMWKNLEKGRAQENGCEVYGAWDDRVPAVFVDGATGEVHDVRVRYQGSRFNRRGGPRIDPQRWTGVAPAAGPTPLAVLSWNVAFPRYKEHEGHRRVVLNKLSSACPGFTYRVGERLMSAVGLAAPRTRYVRVQVNGAYYHYMLEIEELDEVLDRLTKKDEPVGDLFKASGCSCDEGPWGWADGRLLEPTCGFDVSQRYAATYERKTNEWKGDSDEVMELLEALHDARAVGTKEALRAFFEAHFDVAKLTDYRAIVNWMGPVDEFFQNYFLYRRTDGKWLLLPWDFDSYLGGAASAPAEASFFIGEKGDLYNRGRWWNVLTDSYFKAYRDEYKQRLVELSASALAPEKVEAIIDEAMGELDLEEARRAPGGLACDHALMQALAKDFVRERTRRLVSRYRR